MTYKIEEGCKGEVCERICIQVCPTNAIKGGLKLPEIDPKLCIDCGVCGSFCPINGIYDQYGRRTYKIESYKRPVAKVIEELCSGCTNCADVCPFGCMEMVPSEFDNHFLVAKNVKPKDCVACRLCVEVCGDKMAIRIFWPDGTEAKNWDVTGKDSVPIILAGYLSVYQESNFN